MAKQPAGDKKGKEIDYVSQDKDWRGVVENELRCAENWNKDWGFLADMNSVDTATTRDQKIQQLEEKLKIMDNVKIVSNQRMSFKGGNIDERITSYNKLRTTELQPFPRRPVKESKYHPMLVEKLGADYKTKPYENYLGSK